MRWKLVAAGLAAALCFCVSACGLLPAAKASLTDTASAAQTTSEAPASSESTAESVLKPPPQAVELSNGFQAESSSVASAEAQSAPGEDSSDTSAVTKSTTAGASQTYLADTETAVVEAINAERAALGLGTLQVNTLLTQAARIRSEELCSTGHWDHTRPNGESWSTVLKQDVPFSFTAAGENLATITHNDPQKTYETDADWWFTEWKNSPAHYENMIRSEFNEVGVGIYFEEREGGIKVAYATTLFAQTEK